MYIYLLSFPFWLNTYCFFVVFHFCFWTINFGSQTSILKELRQREIAMSFLGRRQYEFPKDSNRIFFQFTNYANSLKNHQNPLLSNYQNNPKGTKETPLTIPFNKCALWTRKTAVRSAYRPISLSKPWSVCQTVKKIIISSDLGPSATTTTTTTTTTRRSQVTPFQPHTQGSV